ncbi:hypothetical protein [Enterocloster bolteae]|uniref:hypothetical protein n=1 Tax=Enterocloster bolteae TaxID=208479 RepID=UPI002A7EFEDF|nr:hypothetical protein [Enterocloster bolteae]
MKNFKEMLDMDLKTTFYNTEEFAQVKRIKYDGIVKDIPVIFDSEETKDRNGIGTDHAEGIYGKFVVVRIQLSDLGKEPRRGARFWIENELYTIANVLNEYNELIIDLERFDE